MLSVLYRSWVIREMSLPLSLLFLSASILSFEIIVIRLLAISHWQPFVTLAISTALLGYGLSGSILGRFKDRVFAHRHILYPALSLAAALLYRPVIHVSGRLHLDPGLMIRDPFQWLKVGLLIVVLTIPFTLASGALALPLLERESVGKYYGWNFLGAALGILIIVAGLDFLDPMDLPRIPALLAGLAYLASLIHFNPEFRSWNIAAAIFICFALLYPPSSAVYGPYKDISYALKLPSAEISAARSGITGRFQVVSAPAIRSAAGLSTRYTGNLPDQAALYLSGDRIGTVILAGGPFDEGLEYLRWQTAASPYLLSGQGGRTAIAGFGGGEEATRAIYLGSTSPVVIDPDKAIKHLIRDHPDLFKEWLFGPGSTAVAGDSVRSHFNSSSLLYDLIVFPTGVNLAAAAAGLTGTAESYEITLQGIDAALGKLDTNGILAITGWNQFPPTGRWKLLNLFSRIDSLKRGGKFDGRVYLVTGWSTHTFLVRAEPFSAGEVEKLSAFCDERGFSLTDGDDAAGIGEWAAAGNEYTGSYEFDLRPPTDSRPYPWHSLKLSYLKHLFGETREAALPRVEWGFFFLIMVLVLTSAFALFALVLSRPAGRPSGGVSFGVYFACLGTGYMAMEILLIKRSGLVTGPPAVSAAVVLASFMLGSGLGSHVAGKMMVQNRHPLWTFPAIVLFTGISYILIPSLLVLPPFARAAVLFLAAAPPAFFMGFPFPSALMLTESDREFLVPWAWALNGYTSVIGSSLAGIMAVTAGFTGLFMFGAACYLTAWWMFLNLRSPGNPGRG